jgi:LacI family transcriptional regulator
MTIDSASHRPVKTRATMKDVAELSGTSLKTVSRVINGEENVSEDTAERVKEAASQLGYRPNFSAGALRRGDGKTKTIGLLLENIANPFSSSLHRGIEEIARQHGVIVFAGSLDEDPDRERELTEAFVSRRVDGLIVVPAGDDQSYLQNEIDAGTALVFVDRTPTGVAADTVVSTNSLGAHEATVHLIHHGHTKIAYIGDYATIYTGAERLEGYKRALKENNIAFNQKYVLQGYHSPEEAEIALRALLNSPDCPTAVFASQNLVTIGALRALRRTNLQHKVALVGFDDIPGADLFDPPVTLISQDVFAMGEAAAKLLFARLDGDVSSPKHIEIPTKLNIRGSGEIAI